MMEAYGMTAGGDPALLIGVTVDDVHTLIDKRRKHERPGHVPSLHFVSTDLGMPTQPPFVVHVIGGCSAHDLMRASELMQRDQGQAAPTGTACATLPLGREDIGSREDIGPTALVVHVDTQGKALINGSVPVRTALVLLSKVMEQLYRADPNEPVSSADTGGPAGG